MIEKVFEGIIKNMMLDVDEHMEILKDQIDITRSEDIKKILR